MGKDFEIPDITKTFEADPTLAALGIAIVFGIYAKITGDTRLLSLFVLVLGAVFVFQTFNYLMGKLMQ